MPTITQTVPDHIESPRSFEEIDKDRGFVSHDMMLASNVVEAASIAAVDLLKNLSAAWCRQDVACARWCSVDIYLTPSTGVFAVGMSVDGKRVETEITSFAAISAAEVHGPRVGVAILSKFIAMGLVGSIFDAANPSLNVPVSMTLRTEEMDRVPSLTAFRSGSNG